MPTTEKTTRELRRSLVAAKEAAQRLYDLEALRPQPDSGKLAKLGGRMEGIEVARRLVDLVCS